MLMAPASDRVQALYRQAGWHIPDKSRAGAPDHLGLELLALADWLEADHVALAPSAPGPSSGFGGFQPLSRPCAVWPRIHST